MMNQKFEIEQKTETIHLLRKEVKHLKQEQEERIASGLKDLKVQMSMQRKEYEAIIKRHLSFIDKIIEEKDALAKKCADLTQEVKTIEKQFKEKLSISEERHQKELKQQRDLWQASEKIKRDKWIQEKTRSIRDQTIKSLEPEIQRMLAQHRMEMNRMDEKIREAVMKERQDQSDLYRQKMDQMEEQFKFEKVKACEQERKYVEEQYLRLTEKEKQEVSLIPTQRIVLVRKKTFD
jgi:hypothetical protein